MGQDVEDGRLVGGRYRLEGVLGRGGMGTVWRGRDETLGRTVAVKELRFPSSIDDEEKQRLIMRTLREAKAIARIRSGSAITVYDVVDEDDRPWIVMELIEGRSLADTIRQDGPLSPRRTAEVGLAVLDVLRAAHREGILHRDVKPSNVLMEEGTGRVVLTDFGIAKVQGDPSITSTGMLVGAPSYISPERARGNPPGPPADMWSLGGLLYAAVEGRPPYDKGSAISTLTAVMTEPLPPLERAGALSEVIFGLLEKDPEKRLDVAGARVLLEMAAAVSDGMDTTGGGATPADVTRSAAGMPPVPPPGGSGSEPRTPPVRTASGLPPIPSLNPPGGRAGSAASGTGAGSGAGNGPGSWPAARQGFGGLGSRRTLAIIAAVVVLLVILGVVVANAVGSDGGGSAAGSDGGTGQQEQQGDKTGQDDGDDEAAEPSSKPEPDNGGKDDGKGEDKGEDGGKDKGKQDGALPDGYRRVADGRFHFSMAMPQDFKRTGTAGAGSGAKYGWPGGGYPKLQVDYNDSPLADAVLAWKGLEPAVRKSSPGYKLLDLQKVKWRGYPTVADWSFLRNEGDQRVRVLNRGFKVDDKRGYAIMVTCKADEWTGEQCRTLRQTAFKTFKPQ
ncbi:serine/threonine protein kinase [Streptomyces armeniacus]|uniref:non-specific serine/threonine protein kinase n=1 Tax=Streptomyces armeniacus TaxID=83291 RepID=A0A345XY31_9ACTN|nr:serine/threonine-protein kinase [Streptomyces armeniacus]AXK36547.1 serine/threonine protein kinase [Streptomyces armeniacus]